MAVSHCRSRMGGITTGFSIIHLFSAMGIRGLSIFIYRGCTCTELTMTTHTFDFSQNSMKTQDMLESLCLVWECRSVQGKERLWLLDLHKYTKIRSMFVLEFHKGGLKIYSMFRILGCIFVTLSLATILSLTIIVVMSFHCHSQRSPANHSAYTSLVFLFSIFLW